ncbi:hypothetical protein HOM50_01120 [bacterium]|jgi:hypothetical protein|nr:hypothetical protein [bacterium]MBT5014992.1 hypothetical protein [bacterium]
MKNKLILAVAILTLGTSGLSAEQNGFKLIMQLSNNLNTLIQRDFPDHPHAEELSRPNNSIRQSTCMAKCLLEKGAQAPTEFVFDGLVYNVDYIRETFLHTLNEADFLLGHITTTAYLTIIQEYIHAAGQTLANSEIFNECKEPCNWHHRTESMNGLFDPFIDPLIM